MAVASQATGAGVDLEKELSCSICTDVLYQPLTLLDCLHTFCGSCLKEWFSWQAASATHSSRSASPYTCPSCRATVRAARPNANVTTLLDMFLQANPNKGKTEQEKSDMRRNYKPGDDVLLPVEVHRDEEDSEDERLMNDIRQLSVADMDPAVAANRRAGRSPGHRPERESHRTRVARRREAAARQEAIERNIAHQPSLRSLLSASGEDSAEIQEEILNSILSSGVLDGIDIDNLTAEQEEELTERIADAYRRRHRHRERDHRSGNDSGPQPTTSSRASTTSSTQPTPPRSRPPASRTHLIEQWTQDTAQSVRRPAASSDAHREDTSTQRPNSAVSTTGTSALRSVTDPSGHVFEGGGIEPDQRRRLQQSRRSTDIASTSQREPHTAVASDIRMTGSTRHNTVPTDVTQSQTPPNATQTGFVTSPPYPVNEPTTQVSSFRAELSASATPAPQNADASQTDIINCSRCSRPSIQHDLHYHCDTCLGGDFNLCLQCYRAGQGCNHWFGFGYAAMSRWQRSAPSGGWPPGYELPHVLLARRFVKPSTQYDPVRLEEGAFCEQCFRHADQSYWHCGTCFEGAWGYCLACVQQGHHCTHPLTPVARIRNDVEAHKVAIGVLRQMPLPHLLANSYYFSLPRSDCAVCSRNIPALHTRLHCSQCRDGGYDVCNDSYNNLVSTGKISVLDGPTGRRRCLQGHPLSIVAFRNLAEDIQQRIVVSEAFGGWQARHDQVNAPQSASTSGLRCLALWSWWPAAEVKDELAFPKFAEITEVEKINADYYLGVYAGQRGLFPANHVKLL